MVGGISPKIKTQNAARTAVCHDSVVVHGAGTDISDTACRRHALFRPPRAQLPASLELGQVLLIVASTLSEEEALDLALALELDGHASEVVRGMTGYYGVLVETHSDRLSACK